MVVVGGEYELDGDVDTERTHLPILCSGFGRLIQLGPGKHLLLKDWKHNKGFRLILKF